MRERIEALQREIRRDTDRRDTLTGQLRDAEENVRGARGRLGSVRKRLAESDARLKQLVEERARHERALDEQREALASQLRTAYMSGREEQIKMLLSQEDPAAFGRMLIYYSYLGRARAGKIEEIQGLVAALEAGRGGGSAGTRAPCRARGRQPPRTVSRWTRPATERTVALRRKMNAQIEARSDTVAKLKREAAALEKLIADLRKAMKDLPPTGGQAFEKVSGRLAWPVAGKIVRDVSARRAAAASNGTASWSRPRAARRSARSTTAASPTRTGCRAWACC